MVLLPWATERNTAQEPQQQDGGCGGQGVHCWAFLASPSPLVPASCDFIRQVDRGSLWPCPFPRHRTGRVAPNPRGAVPGPPTPPPNHLQGQAGSHSQHGMVLPFPPSQVRGVGQVAGVLFLKHSPLGTQHIIENHCDSPGSQTGFVLILSGGPRAITGSSTSSPRPEPPPFHREGTLLHNWVPFSFCVLKWAFWKQGSGDSF